MCDLRSAAIRKEVAKDSVITRFRQISDNRKTAVRLFVRVNVLKLFKILTDDKQVKRHVVQDVELFYLLPRRGVKNREPEFVFLPCPGR